jgi:adenylate cyclase
MERRPATILAADVVGHTTLMGANDAGTQRRLVELRQAVLEPLIAHHHESIDKLTNNGLLTDKGQAPIQAPVPG